MVEKIIEAKVRGYLGVIAIRNLIFVLIVGGTVGLVIHIVFKTKKSASVDIMAGILGAFLGNVLLTVLRGGIPQIKLAGLLVFEVIGALLVISIVRLLSKDK